jgi:hypothetical protein
VQLNFKFDEKDETAEFTGNFATSEVEFLLQYAVQSLMQKGLMSVQQGEDEEPVH